MHRIQNNRGAARMRVLCGILGVLSFFFGLATFFTGLALALDSYGDTGVVFAIVVLALATFVLFVQSVLMFLLPARLERAEQTAAAQVAAASAQPTASAVSAPTPGPAPAPAPHAPETPASAPASNKPADEETARMIMRSDDIFATAKDLIHMRHAKPQNARKVTHLASMLEAAGIAQWEDAPACAVTKLGRTGNYWLRANTEDMSADDYDRYIAAEAALNIDLALGELADKPREDKATTERVLEYLRKLVDQSVKPYNFGPGFGQAYPDGGAQATSGEWFARACIANDAECVVLPFRLLHNLRMQAALGTAVLRIEIPRPACFAIVTSGRTRQIALARAYALRLSWLLASHAFQNVTTLTRLEVLCCEHDSPNVLLAIDYTLPLVRRLASAVHGTDIESDSFPHDDAIVASFDDKGWFSPVEPPLPFASEVVAPSAWFVYPEVDTRELSPRCAELTGAAHVRDLAINENGPRTQAADTLIAQWHELTHRSCENVVATLVDMRNSTADVSIVEACDRTTTALLDGSVDPSNDDELRSLLISDGTLQVAASRGAQLLDSEDSPDPEQAVSVLLEALGPILSVGFYADDESCVYRYFGSVAERLVFNTRIDDHTREVRLVPDSYYNALSILSSAYTAMGMNKDAAAVADEMLRIAPTSMDAVMRKVRALENDSRVFEAAELIKSQTPLAITARDAALAHYRLAYMEWKLGREDLACACYQRALTWDTNLSEQARTELNDLLESYPSLSRLSNDEVRKKLYDEGIPMGFTPEDRERILAAATLLTDEHAFVIAVQLVSIICAAEGDDVLVSIRRTLLQ